MRILWQVSLCCLLAGGTALAQRSEPVTRGGGFRVGPRGLAGSTGFRGGYTRGGTFGNGLSFPGNRSFGNRSFGVSLFAPDWCCYYPGYYPYNFGFSSYWPSPSYESLYEYAYPYTAYQTSPNVTVIYPAQPAVSQPLPAQRARPVMREYDENGLEMPSAGSPLYLIAFTDHTIRTAVSYRVDGQTLRYMTPERQDQDAPLDSVDRALSERLNRERRIPFQLPPQ